MNAEMFRPFPAETISLPTRSHHQNPNHLINTTATRSVRLLLLQRLPLITDHPYFRRLSPHIQLCPRRIRIRIRTCTINSLLPSFSTPVSTSERAFSHASLSRATRHVLDTTSSSVIAILAADLTHQSGRLISRTSIIIAVTTIMAEVLNIYELATKELKQGRTSKRCVLHHPFPLQHLTYSKSLDVNFYWRSRR
jgi:hypothetical protein